MRAPWSRCPAVRHTLVSALLLAHGGELGGSVGRYLVPSIREPEGWDPQAEWNRCPWQDGCRKLVAVSFLRGTRVASITHKRVSQIRDPHGPASSGGKVSSMVPLPQPPLAAERWTLRNQGSYCDHRTPIHPTSSDALLGPGDKEQVLPSATQRLPCEKGVWCCQMWGVGWVMVEKVFRNQDLT